MIRFDGGRWNGGRFASGRYSGQWTPARLPGLAHWRGGAEPASGRLYTDSTGATPVATFGETVGLLARAAGTVNAIQTTGANRPVSGRHPRGGRRNLLTHTEARSDTSGNNRLFEWRIEDSAGGLGTCTFDIAEVQTEAGAAATPYQRVGATANDVTETGRETVWHVAATGAQALPLTLPAGAYSRAWVDSTGAVTVTRDLTETTAANTAPEGRSVDAVVAAGSMTADDEARIRAWWGRYSAG